jgi:hypothetical protein
MKDTIFTPDLGYMRIPTKTDSNSERRPTVIPTQSRQQSERSDAGELIISEVDGFGQTRTHFSPN